MYTVKEIMSGFFHSRIAIFLCIALAFAAGLGIGIFLPSPLQNTLQPNLNNDLFQEKRSGGYTFINPLLECGYSNDIIFRELKPFKQTIKNLVDAKKQNGDIDDASVYFRQLNDGRWLGINQDAPFLGSSLLKLPTLITYLKEAEKNPKILDEEIKIDIPNDFNETRDIKSMHRIEMGKTYPVSQLLEYLIKYSDNDASDRLFYHINRDLLNKTYEDLGIPVPDFAHQNDTITVRDYASFFRILYNATYLSKEMSEYALNILSQVEYKGALVDGIPDKVPVAHKFGERQIGDEYQLHDCGIIYYPKTPYILCIMTKGKNMTKLPNVISTISKAIYKEIDSQFHEPIR